MQPAFLKQTQRRSIAAPTGCFVLVHPKNGKKESLVVERVVQIVSSMSLLQDCNRSE